MSNGSIFPEYVDVDYSDGADESPGSYPSLSRKLEKAIEVTRTALETYRNPVLMWTGGKDSTLALYVALEVSRQFDLDPPTALFIDHLQHFEETLDFVDTWAGRWGVELVITTNENVRRYVAEHELEPGEDVPVDALDEVNRRHVREVLGYEEEMFPFLLDTYVGSHLLKTVALNDALESHGFDGVLSGVRWSEQEARADETFFSPRHDEAQTPPHDRIHPLLPFDEQAVWDALWKVVVPDTVEGYPDTGHVPQGQTDLPPDVSMSDIPVSPLYFAGFRSIGSEASTEKQDETPAWVQNFETTAEREGRAQDKEQLMEQLRDLGYM